jgi:protein-tyrosine phosphatase
MDWIRERLAVGSFGEAQAPPAEVDALLCVAAERDADPGPRLYHKVPVVDMRPIPPEQLAEAVAWIRNHIADHRILVFCNEGVGRSPSVAVAYLCLGEGLAFGAAVEVVARRRPRTSTLPGLIQAVAEAGRLLDG